MFAASTASAEAPNCCKTGPSWPVDNALENPKNKKYINIKKFYLKVLVVKQLKMQYDFKVSYKTDKFNSRPRYFELGLKKNLCRKTK